MQLEIIFVIIILIRTLLQIKLECVIIYNYVELDGLNNIIGHICIFMEEIAIMRLNNLLLIAFVAEHTLLFFTLMRHPSEEVRVC